MKNIENDENTEQRVIAAAKEEFLAKGFDGARMQAIANLANINKAMLHYYFRSKDKLFSRIFEEIFKTNFPKIDKIIFEDANFEQVVHNFVDVYITMIQRNPFAPMFILHEMNRNPAIFADIADKFLKDRFIGIIELLNKEIEKGNYRQVDPRSFFVDLIALCVFPFMSKPIVKPLLGMNDDEYKQFIEERKKTIPETLLNNLKKR